MKKIIDRIKLCIRIYKAKEFVLVTRNDSKMGDLFANCKGDLVMYTCETLEAILDKAELDYLQDQAIKNTYNILNN